MGRRVMLGGAIAGVLVALWLTSSLLGHDRSPLQEGSMPMDPVPKEPLTEGPVPIIAAPDETSAKEEEEPPARTAVAPPPSPSDLAVDPIPTEIDAEAPPIPMGVISGRLMPESGEFQGDPNTLIRGITLDAVSRGQPRTTATATLRPVHDSGGRFIAVAFETEELPAVEYELTLSQLRPRRWDRTSARVLAPQSDVEFLCYDGDSEVSVEFVVLDAATGEAVDDWKVSQFRMSASKESGVLLHAGPLDVEDMPLDAELQWVVEADDYAPSFGSELDFEMSADGSSKSATVRLVKGFATRLVVLGVSPERVPAGRATVWLDGQRVGQTDDSGQILLRSLAKPKSIEIQWHDQSLKGPFDRACLARRSHLHVALLETQ